VPLPFEIALEDAGDGKAGAAAGVDALAAAGAIAVVGPVDRDAAEEAAARAAAHGLPLVTLDVAESGAGSAQPTVFRAVISVEARARALAAHAAAAGITRFAILAPELAYGARAAAAFRAEVAARGGEIVAEVHYPRDTTSFVDPVNRLAKARFDALFVPDTAARLELVAPQLAVADLVVQPAGAARPRRGRAVVLLSTAEALGPRFLRGSGRYARGAVLAPGFYPDEGDARIGAYVARYRLGHGEDPTYLDAYAYDAALVVRAAVEAGARDRASLAAALAAGRTPGLTGDIAFDPASHARADAGVLFGVSADGTTIRAMR
jgi:ABC-type branched-subunit amino acid transport system substrate-binding protein